MQETRVGYHIAGNWDIPLIASHPKVSHTTAPKRKVTPAAQYGGLHYIAPLPSFSIRQSYTFQPTAEQSLSQSKGLCTCDRCQKNRREAYNQFYQVRERVRQQVLAQKQAQQQQAQLQAQQQLLQAQAYAARQVQMQAAQQTSSNSSNERASNNIAIATHSAPTLGRPFEVQQERLPQPYLGSEPLRASQNNISAASQVARPNVEATMSQSMPASGAVATSAKIIEKTSQPTDSTNGASESVPRKVAQAPSKSPRQLRLSKDQQVNLVANFMTRAVMMLVCQLHWRQSSLICHL